MTVEELASAITQQETGRLTRVPGIGKKTAERLLLELRGKLGADLAHAPGTPSAGRDDILNALLSLGYSSNETQAALKGLPEGVEVAEGIRLALKSLRSEEHTSELQSLMRNSYAVFCLKQKNKKQNK